MPETVQVGTILMKEWPGMPPLSGFETEPCLREWSLVKVLNGLELDRKIHAAGWNFFFMAGEIKATFLGSIGPARIQSALKRIAAKVTGQHFNSLEITEIITRHFLGVPYVTVSAHSRHMQQSCYLDGLEARRTSQTDAAWAKG